MQQFWLRVSVRRRVQFCRTKAALTALGTGTRRVVVENGLVLVVHSHLVPWVEKATASPGTCRYLGSFVTDLMGAQDRQWKMFQQRKNASNSQEFLMLSNSESHRLVEGF